MMDSIAFTFEEEPFPDIFKDLDTFDIPLHFPDLTADHVFQENAPLPHEISAPPAAEDPPHLPANQDDGDNDGAQKGNTKQKQTKHRELERERRKDMASLHRSLRTLLPLEYIKGKRSMSDHLDGAAKYITNLRASNQVMMGKMNKLKAAKIRSWTTNADVDMLGDSSGLSIDNETGCSDPYCDQVVVKASKEGIEVLVRVRQGRALSRVLRSVAQEGLDVTSCLTTRLLDDQSLHCIQAKVEDGRNIDTDLLAAKLSTNKYWP